MKKIIIMLVLTIAGTISFSATAQVNLGVNIASQPLWGPVGYDHVEYYYIPDMESYYHVPSRKFIYSNNGKWIFSSSKPERFGNYNLYNGYKVVINSPKPYLGFEQHKVKYVKFKANRSQVAISRSNDPKYNVIKGHPSHSQKKNKGSVKSSPNGLKGNGQGKAKSKGKG